MSETSTVRGLVGVAPAESFSSTLQREPFYRRRWNARQQPRQDIAMWIQSCYNEHRLHSTIRMFTPLECEQANSPDPHNQPLHD